jgi:hypothetical protein
MQDRGLWSSVTGYRQNPPETLLVHEWNNIPQAFINDWLVLCVGDAKLSLLQEVVTHVTELHKPLSCMTIISQDSLLSEDNNTLLKLGDVVVVIVW